ncbi:AAA ATPase domain protein [Solidesulfovibrio magneticus RS-1]|uniref:AAA ATPase domain protein n=3 Tax=Bacteria TaxID=2 RepID=C4XP71_SOLM1|nr:AAA ATPase domain protein [Solidesulfovibrio magneticus RS-1]
MCGANQFHTVAGCNTQPANIPRLSPETAMRQFTLDIIDEATSQRERLLLTAREVDRLRREDDDTPLSLLLARHIEALARQRGFSLEGERAKIRDAARMLLVEEEAVIRLHASPPAEAAPAKTAPVEAAQVQPPPFDNPLPPLLLCRYDDPIQTRDRLCDILAQANRVPVFWSRTRGLQLLDASRRAALDDDVPGDALRDPAALLEFILARPNPRIAYVLEDFHHYIGGSEMLGPEYGRLRALLRDLGAVLAHREETVCLLTPAGFELPEELQAYFTPAFAAGPAEAALLGRYGTLLTEQPALGRLKPVIGAEDSIQRVLQVLGRMEANNPLLVGHPGVGKTAVVEGLAQRIASGAAPTLVRGRRLYALSLASIVSGTRYRGDLEARMESLLREVLRERDNIIVFIDEIHVLLQAGGAEGSMGIAEMLKPVLARGQFPCIGATTVEGERLLAADPALSRRFQKVLIQEPDRDQCLDILRGLAPCFERHHAVAIADDALRAAVDLSIKHLHDSRLPGKAVALLDGAASLCALRGKSTVQLMDVFAEMEKVRRHQGSL